MKVIIAGSRLFNDYETLKEVCDSILIDESDVEIVSGGALGADSFGEKYAKERGYKITQFLPDYKKFKNQPRYAPIHRNKQMAEYADTLIAFWDRESRGTKSMIELAQQNKLKIHIENV
jgi:hypothetical protein